jgi:hypothetical protein
MLYTAPGSRMRKGQAPRGELRRFYRYNIPGSKIVTPRSRFSSHHTRKGKEKEKEKGKQAMGNLLLMRIAKKRNAFETL